MLVYYYTISIVDDMKSKGDCMFLSLLRLKERFFFAISGLFRSKNRNCDIYYDEDLQRYREEKHIWY